MPLYWDLLYVLFCNLVLFSALWLVIFSWSRISWVDVLWSASLGAWSLDYLHFWEKDFHLGTPLGLLALLYFLWSYRLSIHLAKRLGAYPAREDPRYQAIKERAGKKWPLQSYIIFLMNGMLVSLLLGPQRLLLRVPQAEITWLFCVGIALGFLAIAGESVADHQLKNFLRNPAHRGRSCQSGLWRYSRHPNYFFEWLFWVGISLALLSYPLGYWSLICPLVMYVFLTRFTGVRLSEKGAASRRADFKDYQRKTSAFFPWFPKD